MALTFLGIIALGTLLLSLPVASRSGKSAERKGKKGRKHESKKKH